MDFTKYVSLLDKQALFFARADLLGDPFEGSVSQATLEMRRAAFEEAGIPEERWVGISHFFRNNRKWAFISCWHIGMYESAAMWHLYAREGKGVAIQSTFGDFTESFREYDEHDIFAGVVHYVDYGKEPISDGNTFAPLLCKRKSFEHEQELRAIIQVYPPANDAGALDFSVEPPHPGLYVDVDLSSLIHEVHVSPSSPDWYEDLVESITRKYGLSKPVHRSALDTEPIF